MTIPKDSRQLENARRLRREMTPHERKRWYLFLRKYPVKIYKQRIIGRFIVDFYCAAARLVVELDGSQHYEPQGLAYDAERSQFLSALGLESPAVTALPKGEPRPSQSPAVTAHPKGEPRPAAIIFGNKKRSVSVPIRSVNCFTYSIYTASNASRMEPME